MEQEQHQNNNFARKPERNANESHQLGQPSSSSPAAGQYNEIKETFLHVPSHKMGAIIGNEGKNVKCLEYLSEAKIHVESFKTYGTRWVRLRGTSKQRRFAEEYIRAVVDLWGSSPILNEGSKWYSRITCPVDKEGLILGKEGKIIENMQFLSRAKIQVRRGVGEVELKGTPRQRRLAKVLITALIDESGSSASPNTGFIAVPSVAKQFLDNENQLERNSDKQLAFPASGYEHPSGPSQMLQLQGPFLTPPAPGTYRGNFPIAVDEGNSSMQVVLPGSGYEHPPGPPQMLEPQPQHEATQGPDHTSPAPGTYPGSFPLSVDGGTKNMQIVFPSPGYEHPLGLSQMLQLQNQYESTQGPYLTPPAPDTYHGNFTLSVDGVNSNLQLVLPGPGYEHPPRPSQMLQPQPQHEATQGPDHTPAPGNSPLSVDEGNSNMQVVLPSPGNEHPQRLPQMLQPQSQHDATRGPDHTPPAPGAYPVNNPLSVGGGNSNMQLTFPAHSNEHPPGQPHQMLQLLSQHETTQEPTPATYHGNIPPSVYYPAPNYLHQPGPSQILQLQPEYEYTQPGSYLTPPAPYVYTQPGTYLTPSAPFVYTQPGTYLTPLSPYVYTQPGTYLMPPAPYGYIQPGSYLTPPVWYLSPAPASHQGYTHYIHPVNTPANIVEETNSSHEGEHQPSLEIPTIDSQSRS